MRHTKLTLLFFATTCLLSTVTLAQPGNVQVRAEGFGVSMPDTINGLQAMAAVGSEIRIVHSFQTTIPVDGGTLGHVLYSPTNPGMHILWKSTALLNSQGPSSPFWGVFDIFSVTNIDGNLPDSIIFGGSAVFGVTFQSDTLVDAFEEKLVLLDTGVFCIDSAFFPPGGEWLVVGDQSYKPTWGGSPVGYPDGGYCITVYQNCCTNPGDANGDGAVNISDLSFIIARIFSGGAAPPCVDEGDVNGDRSLNIADAAFLVSRIFQVGPAPHCWWQPDPVFALDFTFLGVPDSLIVSPCGTFADTFFVQVFNELFPRDTVAQFTVVNASSGISASFGGTNSDSLFISGTVSAAEDEFVIIRAESVPVQSGGLVTDKIILITCQ